jgi:hypothetical protein
VLLLYLTCAARGLPAVYISRATSWVSAACEPGGGNAHLLDAFWCQNADVFIERPGLRSVFAAVLRGDTAPFTAGVMESLREAVGTPALPGCAVIVDDVQYITAAVQGALVPQPIRERQTAGHYFTTNRHGWARSNGVFRRMSVASAHAEHDAKLPPDEARRLRIIESLDPMHRAAQQGAAAPAAAREGPCGTREYLGGNILRRIVTGAQLLPRGRKSNQADLDPQTWIRCGMRCECAWR